MSESNLYPRKISGTSDHQLTAPETHADQKLVDGIVRMGAATRISLGLSSVAVWWYSDYRAMAWGTLSGTVMAIVDG